MPVGLPPLGGPLGRSRSRISASGLTTFLRCERQWFLGSKLGLSGPTTPSQVLGIVIEDELCGLLMHRPDASINSLTDLSHWIAQKSPMLRDVHKRLGRLIGTLRYGERPIGFGTKSNSKQWRKNFVQA